MKVSPRPVELLSPAKDLQCGIEAIKHGADAVYIGAPKFGARAAAGNTLQDIEQLCHFAHLYGVRIYVALNTILNDSEMEEVEQMIRELYRIGVDAIIVQDMGITQLNLPPIPLHASTQTDNRTVEKVKFLESAGFSQVVLARELSLNQIREIAGQTTVPLEVFIHGALCVSYSGQCYISAAIHGRSANRGACAQYCRLPYRMTDATGKEIYTDKHLLSLKDLNRSDDLEALLDAGVSSFKIEGRLKDVSYVKNITAWYRQKLDAIFERRKDFIPASQGKTSFFFTPDPSRSFNRGFTSFYLTGRSADVVTMDTPKSQGKYIGKVKSIGKDHIVIKDLWEPLHNGDGLTFFRASGQLEGFRVNKVEGERVYPHQMLHFGPGTSLYRNLDFEFEKQLEKESAERKIPVKIEFSDNTFGFTLAVSDIYGAGVMLTEEYQKEPARTDQKENIHTQLAKLGNTPFVAEQIKVELTGNWFVPSSLLSRMRRAAIEKLENNRQIRYRKELIKKRSFSCSLKYPESQLTYLGNVSNWQAARFYTQYGVQSIDPAFENKPLQQVPLMFSRHCLRYTLGICPTYQQPEKDLYKEPFYLLHKNLRLRLTFDCKNCQMKIWKEENIQ